MKLAVVVFTVWVLDYFSAVYLNYPFAYCWGDALLRPLLVPIASLALLVVAGYWFVTMATAGVLSGKALGALFWLFLIGGADQFTKTLFAFGRSCQ